MKLTAADLERFGACQSGVKRFRDLFGEGPVTITAALCMEHPEFNYRWAARHLLPAEVQAEYERQYAALWVEFDHRRAAHFGTLAERVP